MALLDIDRAGAEETAAAIAGETGVPALGIECEVTDRQRVARRSRRPPTRSAGSTPSRRTPASHAMPSSQEDGRAVGQRDRSAPDRHLRVPPGRSVYSVARGPGRIVCISSVSGATGNLGRRTTAPRKAGSIHGRDRRARDGRSETTANAVRPGFIDTAMTRAMSDEARRRFLAAISRARGPARRGRRGRGFPCQRRRAHRGTIDVTAGFYLYEHQRRVPWQGYGPVQLAIDAEQIATMCGRHGRPTASLPRRGSDRPTGLCDRARLAGDQGGAGRASSSGADVGRIVHGEQRMTFHRLHPLRRSPHQLGQPPR